LSVADSMIENSDYESLRGSEVLTG